MDQPDWRALTETTNYKFPPLESDALSHLSLPHLHTLLAGFSQDSPQLHCHGTLDGFHIRQTCLLDDPLEVGEKEKKNDTAWRCFFAARKCQMLRVLPFCAVLRAARCRGEAAVGCLATTRASSHTLKTKQMSQDPSVDMLVECPALWQPTNPYPTHSSHSTLNPVTFLTHHIFFEFVVQYLVS